jgi:hypothetical protein
MENKHLLGMTIILLTFALVFFIAKFIVMPTYGEYEKLKTDYAASVELQKETALDLLNVKSVVREEFNSQDANCVYKYIKICTTNLTDATMRLIATAIVKHSWEEKLPLGIMVAVAETRSNFNPTKLTGFLRGIYQVDENRVLASGVKPETLHTIDGGVMAGCKLMKEEFLSTKNWVSTLEQFNFQKRNSEFIKEVFSNTATFVSFQHQFNVKIQEKLDVKKKMEAHLAETKE